MEIGLIVLTVNVVLALLSEEAIRSLCVVRDQVEQLGRELTRMQSFLEDMSTRIRSGGAMSQNWVVEATELANECEDIIETFLLKVASRRKGGAGPTLKRYACIFHEWYLVVEVCRQIRNVNGKIKSFHRSLEVHGIKGIKDESSSSSVSKSEPHWRTTYPHVEEYTTARLGKDAEMVAKILVQDDKCRVVSIYGLGGLGKTALARKVFQHKEVESYFVGGIAWACISQQYNAIAILRRILTKLIAPEMRESVKSMSEDDLLGELYRVQKERNCLVVLDDIWSIDAWHSFKDAFLITENINTGSKILITTREKALGPQIHPSCFCYQPSCLDEEESWNLLKSIAFGTGSIIDSRMEAEGKKMANKCKGLPLAITVLGGRLAAEKTLSGWRTVYEDIQSERSSQGHEETDILSKVLALSYHALPYKLKPCFLYFSYFPEDFEMPAEKLCHLWIAESMVLIDDKLEHETMMDVAERYLRELAGRSIVHLELGKFTGNIKYCCMHDEMRKLCLAKAKMHNFVKVNRLPHGTDAVDCSSNAPNTRVRRLAAHLSAGLERVTLPKDQLEASQYLRSILFFFPSSDPCLLELESNFKSFILLRTLDMEGFNFGEKSPEAVGKLTRLRYLSFKNCKMGKLPASIRKLKHLETLDLRARIFRSGDEIDLGNMERLTHLYLADVPCKFKLHGLTKLETLEGFKTGACDVHDLCDMKNLRQLDATFLMDDNQDLSTFLDYLTSSTHHLRKTSLKIDGSEFPREQLVLLGKLLACGHLYKLDLLCRLPELPEFECSSSGLVKLTLHRSELQDDPMPTLERLPDLLKLFLSGAFVGNPMVCRPRGFPKLKMLSLLCLNSLTHWRVEKGAMPELVVLHTTNCGGLDMVPEGLASIATLERITAKRMSQTFETELHNTKFQKEDIRIRIS